MVGHYKLNQYVVAPCTLTKQREAYAYTSVRLLMVDQIHARAWQYRLSCNFFMALSISFYTR